MKNIARTLLSAALFGACTLAVQAQPALKIAVVDMAKLYDSHWQTEEQNAKLNKDQQTASEQMQQLVAEGQALVDQYKDLDEQSKSPTLTNEARAKAQADAQKKYAEIQTKQNDVATFRDNAQRSLQQRIKTFRDLMLEQISNVASKIAKDKGATLLLDKSGPTAIGVSSIIYFDPAYDITDEVMKELNKDRPAPSAVAAPAPAAGAPAPTTPAAAPAPAPAPAGGAPMITVPGAKK
ncbi:MAG TPA: OmpH family outer membrane protein [Opitutaceae bacterium]|nr:OmpH family outer membrane protein [Opitutaceae bacterium]